MKKETMNGREGYVDKYGNVWAKPKVKGLGKPHWNLQLSKRAPESWRKLAKKKGKNYLNIGFDGEITH